MRAPTAKQIRAVCDLVAAGNRVETAAASEGIAAGELEEWIETGLALPPNSTRTPVKFVRELRKAEAKAEVEAVRLVGAGKVERGRLLLERANERAADKELRRMRELTTDAARP